MGPTSDGISGATVVASRVRPAHVVAITCIGLLALVSACVPPPPAQAYLWVPGVFRADVWSPPPGTAPGSASVELCTATPTAVRLETAPGPDDRTDGSIGLIRLRWQGTLHEAISDDGTAPVTLTTPVIGPGCGQLTYYGTCCSTERFLGIRATVVG